MLTPALRAFLLPPSAKDPGFQAELNVLAFLTLRLVGGLEAAVPLVMIALRIGVLPVPITGWKSLCPNLALSVIGALTLAASLTSVGRRRARLVTLLSVWLAAAAFQTSYVWLNVDIPWADHYLIGNLILIQLGACTLPVHPVQMLALGISIDAVYAIMYSWARRIDLLSHGFGPGQTIFAVLVTVACTVLTAAIFRARASGYFAHQRALRDAEDLRRAQSQLLITENAAAMGRLAAALSHELNSPIGVLSSAVDTLAAAANRRNHTADPAAERVLRIVGETQRAARESVERLRSLIGGMQRFTNLDRAEVQTLQVNDLIRDVMLLLEPEAAGAADLRFEPDPMLPRVTARPQQLSAVFAHVIGNAIQSGGNPAAVAIRTRHHEGGIEVTVSGNGPGMTAEEIANAFNPAAFRQSGARMAAANWSLYSCRQIIEEHGGRIGIESGPEGGTRVEIHIPD